MRSNFLLFTILNILLGSCCDVIKFDRIPICYKGKTIYLGDNKDKVSEVFNNRLHWNDSQENGLNDFWQYYIQDSLIIDNNIYKLNITVLFKCDKLVWFGVTYFNISDSSEGRAKAIEKFYHNCIKDYKIIHNYKLNAVEYYKENELYEERLVIHGEEDYKVSYTIFIKKYNDKII